MTERAVKRTKWWLIGAGVAVGALLLAAAGVARFAGVFTAFHPGFSGSCAAVENLGGSSEDVQIDRKRGLAYLSVRDRVVARTDDTVKGTVSRLDLNVPEPAPLPALRDQGLDLRPLGMSFFERGSDPARLFVISLHGDGPHAVYVFRQYEDGLFDVDGAPIRDPAFVHPNAIAAVGPRQFYLVNNSAEAGKSAREREMLLRRARATLLYYDGAEARLAASGLAAPSGLALSPDTTHLYVSETLAKALRVYRRDLATGELTLEETVALDAAPDNLNVDADGVVWIAAHPKLFAFLAHVDDPAHHAPTLVLRFDPRRKPAAGEPDTRLTQVYANAGEQISAGSVAAAWREEFLIGAVLEPKVLICKTTP